MTYQVGDVLLVVPERGCTQLGRITDAVKNDDGSVALTLVEPRLADAGLGYMTLPE